MNIVSKDDLYPFAAGRMRPVHSLLEIGPGIQPQMMVIPLMRICVEPYDEYAAILSAAHPDYLVLNCTWGEALEILLPGSVDTVMLIDVIEHLEKEEARVLLDASVRLARSQVVVQTPLGFLAQGEGEEKDAWGLDGVNWQIHRSGWLPEDFPEWDIIACEQFHTEDAYGRPLDVPHGAFFAILDKGTGVEPGAANELVANLVREREEIRHSYEDSTSWRITRPIRWLRELVSSDK